MTTSEIKEREIRSKEDIADKDRAQKEKSDKRAAKAGFYGSAVRGISSMLGKINDATWYKQLLGATETSTSIPDFQTLGQVDPIVMDDKHRNSGCVSVQNVPAVVQIHYIPTIGPTHFRYKTNQLVLTTPDKSAMNRAINRVNTQLENRNSRTSTYSRDTIGRYLFIATDIASDILKLKAVIDVFTKAESTKPFIARQLIRAMGYQYNSVKTEIANLKLDYNLLAHDFNEGIPLPSDLSYVKRQLWLANTVISDSHTEYSTYAVFNKAVEFDLITESSAFKVVDHYASRRVSPTGRAITTAVFQLRTKMDALINGATWKPLIRDLRGGTKSNSWIKLPEDVFKPTINFTDVDEVRYQLQNMVSLPAIIYKLNGLSTDGKMFGVAFDSASVAGNSKEAVTQSAFDGNTHGATYDSSVGTLEQCAPGSIFIQFKDANAQSGFMQDFEQAYPNMFSNPSVLNRPYILNHVGKVSSDDYLVSSRLKLAWKARKLNLVIRNGDSPVQLACENGMISLSATGTYYFVVLEPIQFGTEVVTGINVFADFDDNASESYMDCISCCGEYAKNGVLSSVGGNYYKAMLSTETAFVESGSPISADMLMQDFIRPMGSLTSMDWFPLTVFVYASQPDDEYWHRYYGELDHYTSYTYSEQDRLNEQSIESEFTLPDSVYLKPLAGQ